MTIIARNKQVKLEHIKITTMLNDSIKSFTLMFFLLLTLLLNGLTITYANSSKPLIDSIVLRPINSAEDKINGKVIRFDFGTLSSLDDKYTEHGIEHTFVLNNSSSQEVTISELKPSCICIHKAYITDGNHTQTRQIDEIQGILLPDVVSLPIKVMPKEQVKFFVSLDPFSVFPGPVLQSVDVMIQGQTSPITTLEMAGVLQSGIDFSTSVLNFHQIKSGKGASALLFLTLDRRLHRSLPDDVILRLISNNPDISVRLINPKFPVTSKISLAPNEFQLLEPNNALTDFPNNSVIEYRIILSPSAKIGPIKGRLVLIAPQFPSIVLLTNATIPFAGEIIGTITDTPQVIVFGGVTHGQSVSKSITITTRQAGMKLKVVSSHSYLQAELLPVLGQTHSWTLVVKLNSQAPVGDLEDNVTVITPHQEHLLVPVFASVNQK